MLFKVYKTAVAALVATALFSCKSDYNKIQNIGKSERFPSGIAKDFFLTYTDSGKVKATLKSKLCFDYSNQPFPYREFPEGLEVHFYDNQKNENTITAKKGYVYSATHLIDLQGDVVLTTHDGKQMKADQLYWDRRNDWIFTEGIYSFTSPDLHMKGTGIDFNRDFSQVSSHGNTGTATIEE